MLNVKRGFLLSVSALQNVHTVVECVSGSNLYSYSVSSRHLFALSCARILLVFLKGRLHDQIFT